jgi:imidazoleglycerol-phosphate dehydratase/histidinol-phosphatase
MKQQKYLFVDRDGTLIVEPQDKQVDRIDKLMLMPNVIPSLLRLQEAGFQLVMVTNQDGLGTQSFPQTDFDVAHQLMLDLFSSQGITFENIHICPHFEIDGCECRKPKVGLVLDYLKSQVIDREKSFVIGDRKTDVILANNMGIKGILLGDEQWPHWEAITQTILGTARKSTVHRKTKETDINVTVDLDNQSMQHIDTGIAFFDHMLGSLAQHAGFGLEAKVKGDLHIDDHHTVEDTALALGQAISQALGDKKGIGRYGFVLPMDEALAQVAIDICGRAYFDFQGVFMREKVGELSTECVPHFFRSLAQTLGASLHISIKGENAHHMSEAIFKAVGRCLRQALQQGESGIPSTKGCL